MIVDLTYRIDTSSIQKATALRDKLAELLNGDEEVAVVHQGSSQVTDTYEVIGVDTATKQPFRELVEAKSEEDAEAQAETGDRVAADVRRA